MHRKINKKIILIPNPGVQLLLLNKKVNARGISPASSEYSFCCPNWVPPGRVPPGRVPPSRVPPWQGTPRQGTPWQDTPPCRVPPSRVPHGRVPPSRVPHGRGQGTPPRCLPHGILGNVANQGTPPGVCPMAFWVMLQSIMGYGYPPHGQTDRHVSKHYLPVVLRTRAVIKQGERIFGPNILWHAIQALINNGFLNNEKVSTIIWLLITLSPSASLNKSVGN